MNEEYLSITEMAKLRNVTSETLRYYDRIGLLKPDYIDPKNGYRYYSVRKSEKLGVIRELRELGMSIEEIQDYFDDCNLKKSVQIMSNQYDKLRSEINEKLLLSGKIAQKLAFLGELTALRDMNEPFLQRFPERYIITLNKPAEGSKNYIYALSELESMLTEISPILATDRLGVFTDERILHPGKGCVPSTPMLFIDNNNNNNNNNNNVQQHMQTIPAGYYLCFVYDKGRLEMYDTRFQKVRKYMAENNLRVNGRIFQRYIIDITMTDRRSETLMEIQVPVTLNKG